VPSLGAGARASIRYLYQRNCRRWSLRIHLRERRLRSWIDSNAQEILSTLLQVLPIGGVSDRSQSLARSTFNAATMETIEHCVTCGRGDSVAGYRSCSIAVWQRDFGIPCKAEMPHYPELFSDNEPFCASSLRTFCGREAGCRLPRYSIG
jgi:hypothetical protein